LSKSIERLVGGAEVFRHREPPSFKFLDHTPTIETAIYFGIEVGVIWQMEHCSMIHYGDPTVVVDAAALVVARAMKIAA
jgi:hypothetical protein